MSTNLKISLVVFTSRRRRNPFPSGFGQYSTDRVSIANATKITANTNNWDEWNWIVNKEMIIYATKETNNLIFHGLVPGNAF
jgi:hypothetical protein